MCTVRLSIVLVSYFIQVAISLLVGDPSLVSGPLCWDHCLDPDVPSPHIEKNLYKLSLVKPGSDLFYFCCVISY